MARGHARPDRIDCSRAGCWRSASAPVCCCPGSAPAVESYWGTDFAEPVIREIGAELRAHDPELADRVELRCRPADDLSELPSGFFDTIVINSVIQYFPSIEYLTTVINGAMELLAPGGALFVGDVRNLRLARTFHTEIAACPGDCPRQSWNARSSAVCSWRRNCSSTRTTLRLWATSSTCAPSAPDTTTS